MIKKIYFELYKNFKIIFRNISSISLLILGPLLLILLIGFAFSGTEVHSIKIGVKASDYESLQPFLDNFTGIGEIEKYEKIDPCINDMRQEKIHICLEFSDGFSDQDEFNQGHIAFYFDNTRKILSNEIVDGISDFLGLTTEKISIESAQTIFKNIETLVVFLDRRNNDILVLINESEKMKSDILQRKERLIEIREDFLPKYEKIKKLQKSIKNISKDVDSSYMSFDSDIDNFKDKVNEIENSIEEVLEVANIPNYYVYEINKTFFITTNKTYLNLNNFSYEKINLSIINITNHEFVIPPVNYSVILNETRKIDYSSLPIDESFNFAMISFKQGINTFEDSIDSFDENITRYYELLNEQKLEFDEIIYQIDNVKILLDEEIDATDTYIKTIDESVIKIT
ncbi:hypothetical protein HN451_00775, partial [archaeon]|nr:hypothetical protein [archaeon]